MSISIGDLVKFRGRNNNDQQIYYVQDEWDDDMYYVYPFKHLTTEYEARGWIVKPSEVRDLFEYEMVDFLAEELKKEMVRTYAESI